VEKSLRALLAVASLALISPVHGAAARSGPNVSDLQAVQGRMEVQLQALAERLDQLEADNAALKGEVAQLNAALGRREAEVEALKAQSQQASEDAAKAAKEADKVKGAEWAGRIKFKGDLRVRSDRLESERVVGSDGATTVEDAADRDRPRFRARLAAEAKVTDTTKVGFGLASGDGDPRSSNQTFTNANSTKSVYIDLAYADWAFAPGARFVLGKQKQPYWRSGQSLFFDSDLNPEGAAVTYERGLFFGSAYGWMLQENYTADPAGRNQDPHVLGAQAGLAFPWLGGETRLGMHYYDCGACQGNAPFWGGGNAYGNTTAADGTLMYDYDVLILEAQLGTRLAGYPFLAWGGWAQNLASGVEYDTAFDLGLSLGRAADPGTWEVSLLYHSTDKDALFAQLIESDFAAGRTDGYGWGARFGYAPVKGVSLNATYFKSWTNKDVAAVSGPGYEIGKDLDYDRLMLDVNYRF
jgi:TolA-binding protein